jgi:hypothetical protein
MPISACGFFPGSGGGELEAPVILSYKDTTRATPKTALASEFSELGGIKPGPPSTCQG